jgi:polysaccharide biosynthesis PFTS motif protein
MYLKEFHCNHFLSLFFLDIPQEFKIALRQKLCLYFLGKTFNSKVLISKHYNTAAIFCLPKEWVDILSTHCRVKKIMTSIKFFLYTIYFGLKSIYNSAKWIWKLFSFKSDFELNYKPYVSFNDLLFANLPMEGNNGSNTIIDWHFNHYNKHEPVFNVVHNLNIEKYNYYNIEINNEFCYLSLTSFFEKLKLLFYFFYIVLISTFLLFIGRWEYFFMIGDIFKSKFYRVIDISLLAKEYFFSYSSFDYRPLWTYVAAARGSKVTLWAYASSFSGIKKNDGSYTRTDYAWEISSWPTILVNTKQFKNYLQNKILYPSIIILSDTPIPNTDSIIPEILFKKMKGKIVISIFDSTPPSDLNAALLLYDPKFRTFANGKKFISDICETFNEDKYLILFKVKRPIKKSYLIDQSYLDFIGEVPKLYRNVFLCHGDISAEKLIRLSNLTISIPFTSTAYTASILNIKSIFYDGSGMVQNDDINLQNIKLIRGKDQLFKLKKILFKL